MSRRPRPRAAFTLIELMVVVTIIGILAGIALPAFKRYIYRARASEGVAMLQEIRAREETYRLDNGQYAAAGANPASVPVRGAVTTWSTSDSSWTQLGVTPDTPGVRFRYSITAGIPPSTPNGVPGFDGSDFWFVSKAEADLDGDGTTFFFEGYSASSHIYCSNTDGFD